MTDKEKYKMSMLAEVASLYYEKHYTQEEVASKLCLSRSRISRLLQEALDRGIVDIRINYDLERHYEFENRFREKYQMKAVYILNNRGRDREEIRQGVARLAANVLSRGMKPNMVVGISWGKTVSRVINAMHFDTPVPIDIVQMIGSIPHMSSLCSPQEIISKFAELSGGRPHFLNAPFLVKDAYIREQFLGDANNDRVLRMAIFCDTIITGVGTFESAIATNSWLGYMNDDYSGEIAANGGIGCICGRFFDRAGMEIPCRWNAECVGITLEQLKRIDDVVCVVSDPRKAAALRAVLRSRTVDILVTDGSTANAVLE